MGRQRIGAIILAAGKGSRMKSSTKKQFMVLQGAPLLCYSLAAFEASSAADLVVVTGEESLDFCRRDIVEAYGFARVRSVVPGGKERYHSVCEGLKELARLGYGAGDMVLIHDGARPLIETEVIERACRDAETYGACVVGMPSKDTVKLADEGGFAASTPDRSFVWTIQTPQAFSFSLIMEAYERLMGDEHWQQGITDDAMVAERLMGKRVRLTEGSYRNIKVTTPEDMVIAEALMTDPSFENTLKKHLEKSGKGYAEAGDKKGK